MLAQEDSWVKAGGTNKFVRLPMSLIRPRAWAPREPNDGKWGHNKRIDYRSSCGSLGAVSCSSRSIHVAQQLLELVGGVERISLTSQHEAIKVQCRDIYILLFFCCWLGVYIHGQVTFFVHGLRSLDQWFCVSSSDYISACIIVPSPSLMLYYVYLYVYKCM